MADELVTVAKAPCKSCPYRPDVPSGVWHEEEYDKLPAYDGEILDQVVKGGTAQFFCHQQDGHLCAGWVGCHGAENLIALRISHRAIDPAVWAYQSPVPLFASGQEACDHGKRDIEDPSDEAHRVMDRIIRKQERLHD